MYSRPRSAVLLRAAQETPPSNNEPHQKELSEPKHSKDGESWHALRDLIKVHLAENENASQATGQRKYEYAIS